MKNSSLEKIEEGVKTAVANSEFITESVAKRISSKLPANLKAMKDSLWLLDGEQRRQRRKEFLKEKRKWQISNAVQRLRTITVYRRTTKNFLPPMQFNVGGVTTGDRKQWCHGLRTFISDRYFDEWQDESGFEHRLQQALGHCRDCRRDGQHLQNICLGDVLRARATLNSGRAGGKDGTVSEIWQTVPFSLVIFIWILFRLGAEYGLGSVSEAWRTWELVGIPKITQPVSFGDFRYICKSAVLQKWYLKTLTDVALKYRKPSNVCTYGFRQGIGPMFITELLRRLLFISHEWGPTIAIGSFDVKTAFDSMDHEVVFGALVARGVPLHIAVALIRELRGLHADVSVPGVAEVVGLPVNSGGRQGGTETTLLWNILLEHGLEDLISSWATEGFGFSFDGAPLVNHAIWADNIFIVASSVEQLHVMFDMLTDKLYAIFLKWKTEELTFITGSNITGVSDRVVQMPDGKSATVRWCTEMQVLGVMLDQKGDTLASMSHRLSKAEGAYGSMAAMLRDPKVPVKERLSAWCRGPVTSALYGAGGWSLTSHTLSDLRRWENKHIRRFLRMRQMSADEHRMEYYRRTNLTIHDLLAKHGLKPIYLRVIKTQHTWTLRWWSFTLDDGAQPLRAYMNLRPAADWANTSDMMTQLDYNNRTSWRHQHSGRRLQWEDFPNACWPQWRTVLNESSAAWLGQRHSFLVKGCTFAGLPFNKFIRPISAVSSRAQGGLPSGGLKRKPSARLETSQWSSIGYLPGGLAEPCREDGCWAEACTVETITDNQVLAQILSGRALPDTWSAATTDSIRISCRVLLWTLIGAHGFRQMML